MVDETYQIIKEIKYYVETELEDDDYYFEDDNQN